MSKENVYDRVHWKGVPLKKNTKKVDTQGIKESKGKDRSGGGPLKLSHKITHYPPFVHAMACSSLCESPMTYFNKPIDAYSSLQGVLVLPSVMSACVCMRVRFLCIPCLSDGRLVSHQYI